MKLYLDNKNIKTNKKGDYVEVNFISILKAVFASIVVIQTSILLVLYILYSIFA